MVEEFEDIKLKSKFYEYRLLLRLKTMKDWQLKCKQYSINIVAGFSECIVVEK